MLWFLAIVVWNLPSQNKCTNITSLLVIVLKLSSTHKELQGCREEYRLGFSKLLKYRRFPQQNVKIRVWKFRVWKFGIRKLGIWKIYNLKICNVKIWNFKLRNLNIWNLTIRNSEFENSELNIEKWIGLFSGWGPVQKLFWDLPM